MKFKINKSDIKSILAKVQGITSRKSSLSITANVLIKSTETGISIAATDLETGFEGFYPAQIEEQGTIAINARKLFEIVNNFSSEEIMFSENENRWVKISNKNVEFQIVGMDYYDFPEIPKIEDVIFFEMESFVMKDMIEKMTIINADSEEKRAHILGVHFNNVTEDNVNLMRMISTDSKRLSKVDIEIPEPISSIPETGILIPKKGLGEVYKFLDMEGLVKIGIKDNHFILKKDNETIIIGLLEGDFPDCSEILDIDDEFSAIDMDKYLFLNMIKRMAILYSDSYKNVVFYFDKDTLLIVSSNPDLGESKEDILINYYGTPFKSAFNPKYFIETLNVIDEDNIILRVFDEETPCYVRGKEDKHYLSVIMPMKI